MPPRGEVLAAAALLWLTAASASASAAPLSLQDAVSYAMAHSPAIAKEAASVSQFREAFVHARSVEFPQLTGSLQNQMQKSQNYAGVYSIIGVPQASVYSQNTASLGTQYTFNGGLSHLQTEMARQQWEQAQSDLNQTRAQVTSTVTGDYFALSGKSEAVRLDEGDLAYQRALVRVAKAKVHAGAAAGVDVLSADAGAAKSQYTLEAARADEQNASETLAQAIGAPLSTQFAAGAGPAQPPLPDDTLNKLIALAQTNRPEVIAAQQGVEIAQTNRRTADVDLFPQIQTFASFGNQFSPTLAAAESQFGPIARGNPGFWQVGISSAISVPFWDWGARRANHRNLDEQVSAAQDALDAARSQVELDVRQAYRAAQTAQMQIVSAQDEARYAIDAARIARLQYENGIKTLIDVQQAQQAALSAQTDLFNARVAYATAVVDLRIALGISTPVEDVADL
jgi:outer membrane protein TolC